MNNYKKAALLCGLLLVSLANAGVVHFEIKKDEPQSPQARVEPDVFRNATELIRSKGYPVENHYITTEDGFILNVVRIPNNQSNRPVVYLQHGLIASCTNYLTNTKNESLAYLLADAGAEVWIGNSRGNSYSLNHTKYTPRDTEFWDFSWDDMATLDLPAVINYIVKTTGQQQIYYVGHSQGTTIAFAAFSENQELASHIKHFFALAPVARVGFMKSPLRLLAPFAKEIDVFLDLFGHGSFSLEPEILKYLQGELCGLWGDEICANLMFLFTGFDKNLFNMTRVPVYVAHNPAGTSVKDVLHWAQEVNSKVFQKFDYGSEAANLKHYGQKTPPQYQPSNMKVPVSLFHGGQDWLVAQEDYDWLRSQLTTVRSETFIEEYEHLDFIWAKNVRELINDIIIQEIFSQK